jgi:hypothetical protein
MAYWIAIGVYVLLWAWMLWELKNTPHQNDF